MVDILERHRREVEWSPDMELEGCDAEKAATLLRGCRSQSFDSSQGKEVPADANGKDAGSPSYTNTNSTGGRDDAATRMKLQPPPPAYGPSSRSTASPGSPSQARSVFGAEAETGEDVGIDVVSRSQESDVKREATGVGGVQISPPLSPRTGPSGGASAMASGSGLGFGAGPSKLQSLADLATQELLTIHDDGEEDHRPRPRPSARTPPCSPGRHMSPNRHHSPRRPVSASASSAPPPRSHHHHLRDRRSCRNRGGRRSFDEDDEQEDEEAEAFARGARSRRNRPRSVSMPEGMELQARAMSGGYSSARRRGGRIEPIKEELDGHEGAAGSRSRAWRVGSETREKGSREPLFGSVEDAEALIALARQRVGWGAEGEEGAEGTGGGEGEGAVEGEEGGICVSLPHMLSKYADMYNKNGRIGIYTRQEREAIIARFKRKRSRRVWKKKIRYNCRKNLADKRLRVKGRFVKMSPEQRAALKLKQKAMRSARAASGGVQSAEAGSMDMDLLAGEEVSSETASGGSGSGATAEGFEEGNEDDMVAEEGDEDEDGEEEDAEEEADEGDEEPFPAEPLKRVRRHSIAY